MNIESWQAPKNVAFYEGEKLDVGPRAFDTSQPHLPEPIYIDPRITTSVHNVFPIAGINHPGSRDRTSQRHMRDHLEDRLVPELKGVIPVTVDFPDGFTSKTRYVHDGPVFEPKKVLKLTGIGLLAVNALMNVGATLHNVTTAAQDAGDVLATTRFYATTDTSPRKIQVPGKPETITLHFPVGAGTFNKAGKADVSQGSIVKITDRIKQNLGPDAHIDKVSIQGNASADWATDADLTRKNPGNITLARERAKIVGSKFTSFMHKIGIKSPKPTIDVVEHDLTSREYSSLSLVAKKAGYNTAQAAVSANDHGAKLTGRLKNLVEKYIVKNRGTDLSVDIVTKQTKPGVPQEIEIPGPQPPEDPIRDYEGMTFTAWPLLLLAGLIPQRFRKEKKIMQKVRTETINYEYGDPVWVRLYKEALTEDGSLKAGSAFYSRKYNHLLRDDRIKTVDRMDYFDMDGVEKAVRVCYVDHTPTDDTRSAFDQILLRVANANLGKVADAISTIVVFPSDNAGTRHGDPSKIALGIDKQMSENTLGVTIPLLELIEMHMPTNPTKEQLGEFMDAIWVLAHEFAGHGTDVDPTKPRKIEQTTTGDYVSHTTWRKMGEPAHDAQDILPAPTGTFDVTRHVTDRSGKTHVMTDRMRASDPRTKEAVLSRIVGYAPTRYGSSSAPEHQAETAAATVAEIDIPYSEAGTTVKPLPYGDFANGYRPSRLSTEVYTDGTGIDVTNLDTLRTVDVAYTRTTVRRDPLLNKIATRARTTRVPLPGEMVRILGYVIGGKRH